MAGRRRRIEPFHIDREAVRAVTSCDAFAELDRVRAEYVPGEHERELFWRLAREQMVRSAHKLPNPALKIVAAKVGAVGAMLGLSSSEITGLVRSLDVPACADAAIANRSIRDFQMEPQFRELWTEQAIRSNPPMRIEFEQATVFGSITEAGDIAKNKSWGRLICIEPLRPEDRLFPRHIAYVLKPGSKLRLRWEVRDTFRQILGDRRSLVSDAMRCTKRWFLERLSISDTKAIRARLDLEPGEFWRLVRRGERLGANGIVSFVMALEEKSKGGFLPFAPLEPALIQIQPAEPGAGPRLP
jgi:hypothetical protein